MRLCIPTLDDRGLDGMPSDHFGRAPFFTFVDTETQAVDTQRNGGVNHVHEACRPLDFLGTRPVDAVACRGLGKRAFSRLEAGGINVYVTLEKDVRSTLSALREGRLRQLTSEEACRGHSNSHSHGHGCHPGLGGGRDRQRGFDTWEGS